VSEAVKMNNRSAGANVVPRLFVLELNAGRIHSMNIDGSDRKTIVTDRHLPDKSAAYTAGVLLALKDGVYYVENVVRELADTAVVGQFCVSDLTLSTCPASRRQTCLASIM
jgi:hypothetical protein